MCVLPVSFSSYSVITWMRLTAGLFPSSALPPSLSLQVCDFMYNYLHNYSSLHPTVSGGLFLSLWYLLSFFLFFLNTHKPVLAPSRPCLLFATVLRLVLSLSLVWGRPVLILERHQSRYSVHEEAGGLLLGRHASSLIIHSHITNLKSLKVCQKGMRGKQNAAVFFFLAYLKLSETARHKHWQ